jgi:cell division protein FtsQ
MGVLSSRNRRRRADGGSTPLLGGPVLLRIVLTVGGLGALGWAALCFDGWAAQSPRFTLRTVQVRGLQRATEHELLRLASVGPGVNLWSLDPAAVGQAMAAHPWVRSVEVTRSLPDTLVLRVEEREPVALAALGDLYVVDAQGVPFKRLSASDRLDLPLLTGIPRDTATQDPAGTAARFREALAVADLYREAYPRPRLSEVFLDEAGFQLLTADGVKVVLARGGTEDQLRRLQRVRDELQQRGVSAAAIHLENRARPGWVAVQLRPGAPTPRQK